MRKIYENIKNDRKYFIPKTVIYYCPKLDIRSLNNKMFIKKELIRVCNFSVTKTFIRKFVFEILKHLSIFINLL